MIKMKNLIRLLILFCLLSGKTFSQVWQWGRQSISTLTNCFGSDADINGNIWVTGNYGNGTLNFSGIILPAPPPNFSANVFIAHYDDNGNILLAKHFTGSLGGVGVYNIKTDLSNNIYVGGHFLGTLILDTISISTGGVPSTFIFKADSLGNVLWAKKFSYLNSYGSSAVLDLDSMNNIVVAGNYDYPGGGGLRNTFIEKLDNNGNNISQFIVTGQNNALNLNPLFVSKSGKYYLTGYFEGTATLNSTTLTSIGGKDIFIAKFSENDSLEWFRNYGTINQDNSGAIASDDNHVYFLDGNRINMLNSFGDSVWGGVIGSPGNTIMSGTCLSVRNDKIIVGGTYGGCQITIGSTVFPFASNTNMFLAEVDSNANYSWGRIAESSGGLGVYSLSSTNSGIYVNGNFGSSTGYSELIVANDTLISNNSSHAEGYLAKLELPATNALSFNSSSFALSISPNPNDGNFSFSLSNFTREGYIEIYNVLGENIFKEIIYSTGKKEVSLKNITAGIYFVKIFDGDNSYFKKVIIERK